MARSDPVRVMVVDDREDARALVRALLAEHPDLTVVAEADGAAAALEAVGRHAPAVALVDARMPLVSGFELAPRLVERLPDLRVVLLTAEVDARVRADAAAAGIDRCVAKGDFAALAAVVRELARREA